LAFDYWAAQPPGTVLPAVVTHLEGFGAFVDVGCGVVSLLGIEDLSVARIPHPRCRFRVGQEIFAVLTGADPQAGKLYLSHKELLGTWLENAKDFSPGMTATGVVRSVQPYGSFIELTPNLAGLTDQTDGLAPGDWVEVSLKAIHPAGMKVKLTVRRILGRAAEPTPLTYFLPKGRMTRWVYSPPQSKRVIARIF
jgi:small subunit ribosomal protein S1